MPTNHTCYINITQSIAFWRDLSTVDAHDIQATGVADLSREQAGLSYQMNIPASMYQRRLEEDSHNGSHEN